MLKYQKLDITNEGYELSNTFETDLYEKENYKERMDNPNGWTTERNFRKVAAIPQFLFSQEPLLKEYLLTVRDNPNYAKRCLRTFLAMNPQYMASEGRF